MQNEQGVSDHVRHVKQHHNQKEPSPIRLPFEGNQVFEGLSIKEFYGIRFAELINHVEVIAVLDIF